MLTYLDFKKKYKIFLYFVLFFILIIISFNESILAMSEKYLEAHMIIEHSIFFLIGILSVIIIEQSLKYILSAEKKKINTSIKKSKLTDKKR